VARIAVGVGVLGPLVLTAIAQWIEIELRLPQLVLPAALLGVVSPLIGFRVAAMMREKHPPNAGVTESLAAFLRATLFAIAAGEVIALFGVLAYMLSGSPLALIGVATQVILGGSIWPTDERLEHFAAGAAVDSNPNPT
jgi:hypothetical protein